jgi:hypothetical protein
MDLGSAFEATLLYTAPDGRTIFRPWGKLGSCYLILAALPLLAACSSEAMRQRIAPPAIDRYAREYIETLATGTADEAAEQFTPRLARQPAVMDSLRSVQTRLAPYAPFDSVALVGAQAFFPQDGGAGRTLVYELHGAAGWAVVRLLILDAGGQRWIEGGTADALTEPLEELNAFTHHLGPAQCLMLVWAVAALAFSLGTAVLVARTRMRHRWLWALAALVGVGKFGMNWTTGATFVSAISVQFPVASAQRLGFAAPWLFTIAFPIGAVVALQKRSEARRALRLPVIAEPVDTLADASAPVEES